MKSAIFIAIAITVSLIVPLHAAEPLRVMSFNIRYGTAKDGENEWNQRRELVFSTIRNFDPHVLGVQEALAFQIDEITDAIPGYAVIGVGRSDGREAGEYSALLVAKDRCQVLDSGTFWLSDTPEVAGSKSWGNDITRICTWAELEDSVNRSKLHAFNTHWDHLSQPSRVKSAELIIDRISTRQPRETPVLLMGDFNAGETNPAFLILINSPLKLRDSFRLLHPDAQQVGTFNGFRGERDGQKIDAILVSPQWKILSTAIDRTNDDGRYPSDHFPVTAVVGPVDVSVSP